MSKKTVFFGLVLTLTNLACFVPDIFALVPQSSPSVDLNLDTKSGQYSHFDIQVAHQGVVIINEPRSEEAGRKTLELEVNAEVRFGQRFTGREGKVVAIRNYQPTSHAKIELAKGTREIKLSEKNRYVISRIKESGPLQAASIQDVLTQAEVELLTYPCDPLCLPRLLNQTNVKQGDTWKVSDQALSTFLGVDHVYENNVRMRLKSINGQQAKIYLLGKAKTEVDDVSNSITVTATMLVDTQQKIVTALRANLRQNRAVGQIAPGFEGVTKIDMKQKRVPSIEALSNKAIAQRTKSKKIERRLKWVSEEGQFALFYDPRWKIIDSEKEAAVLRYVRQGALLAQCNVVQLPSRPKNSMLSMEKFKAEVKNIITKEESARIVDDRKITTPNGSQALQVRVDGVEQKVPVTWIYYHVGHSDGRQVTFVFTLEQQIVDQFLPADRALVNSIKFYPLKTRSANKPKQTR